MKLLSSLNGKPEKLFTVIKIIAGFQVNSNPRLPRLLQKFTWMGEYTSVVSIKTRAFFYQTLKCHLTVQQSGGWGVGESERLLWAGPRVFG